MPKVSAVTLCARPQYFAASAGAVKGLSRSPDDIGYFRLASEQPAWACCRRPCCCSARDGRAVGPQRSRSKALCAPFANRPVSPNAYAAKLTKLMALSA